MIASTVTVAERPDLIEAMWSMPNPWPTYMLKDPVSNMFFGRLAEVFPEHQLLALDGQGAIVGKINSVPFAWAGTDDDQAARRNVQRLGLSDLFGLVRPTVKSQEPRTPMSEYVARVRGDGLPADPWLRVHVALPAVDDHPRKPRQWREWTGLPLTSSGLLDVPEALVPVHVSVEHDHAVYVEPNVWVHHRLSIT